MLYEAGIDVVNIADGPGRSRAWGPPPVALGEAEGLTETVVHYCCRDRNLLGMQMT